MLDDDKSLADACRGWQGGRDLGSTPLRAAARVLTGRQHYFEAAFITDQEQKARSNPPALEVAAVLLQSVNQAPQRTARGMEPRARAAGGTVRRTGVGTEVGVRRADRGRADDRPS
jgi:hypothetical protein